MIWNVILISSKSLCRLTVRLSFIIVAIAFSSLQNYASDVQSEGEEGNVASTSKVTKRHDEKFQMKLNVEHGHIGHVFIGCEEGATDGFDSKIDDMAPPPGMGGVGYTFLVSPDRKYNLYRDVRGFSNTVQWVFYAKIGAHPIEVHWDVNEIPQGWSMYCSPWDGKSEKVSVTHDCRKTSSIKSAKTGFIRFWMEREGIAKTNE